MHQFEYYTNGIEEHAARMTYRKHLAQFGITGNDASIMFTVTHCLWVALQHGKKQEVFLLRANIRSIRAYLCDFNKNSVNVYFESKFRNKVERIILSLFKRYDNDCYAEMLDTLNRKKEIKCTNQ